MLAALATDDLRTKYLPVLQALRLVARAGPRFVGVYLVLATVLTAAQAAFDIAVTVLVGPRGVDTALLVDPFAVLVSGLVFTPVAIALYAAAFDEALTAALRRSPPGRSDGAVDQGRSPGAVDQGRSPGAVDQGRSPGAVDLGRSPGTAGAVTAGPPAGSGRPPATAASGPGRRSGRG